MPKTKQTARENKPKNILVIRLSAIGDVAMTVPVLWSLVKHNPDVRVTFVSQSFARDIISQIPEIQFYEAETKNRHKGFLGILKLFRELKHLDRFDAVADLHSVIRSRVIGILFRVGGTRYEVIDKGRKEKKQLCSVMNKNLVELKPTTERYADVFRHLNLAVSNDFDYLFDEARLPGDISTYLGYKTDRWIGVAPFAKHKGKIYPLELMEVVVSRLAANKNYKIVLIGGRAFERDVLEEWAKKYPNTFSIAGRYSILNELKIISNLDVLISMDSANMHLASLVNTPVVSIWGATHRFAGFYGWRQNAENTVEVELYCRPCSVYGNKPCFRKDYACLNRITPEMIISKANSVVDRYGLSLIHI